MIELSCNILFNFPSQVFIFSKIEGYIIASIFSLKLVMFVTTYLCDYPWETAGCDV